MKLIYRVPTLDEALDTTLWMQEDGRTPSFVIVETNSIIPPKIMCILDYKN